MYLRCRSLPDLLFLNKVTPSPAMNDQERTFDDFMHSRNGFHYASPELLDLKLEHNGKKFGIG